MGGLINDADITSHAAVRLIKELEKNANLTVWFGCNLFCYKFSLTELLLHQTDSLL